MTNTNSMLLNVSAEREINPVRLRRTATSETANAIGAVAKITLGPSQLSGWPQQNLIANPTPTSGIVLINRATFPNMIRLLRLSDVIAGTSSLPQAKKAKQLGRMSAGNDDQGLFALC